MKEKYKQTTSEMKSNYKQKVAAEEEKIYGESKFHAPKRAKRGGGRKKRGRKK